MTSRIHIYQFATFWWSAIILLKKPNLSVNLSKCDLIKASVTFLGHTVGYCCIAPLQARMVHIKEPLLLIDKSILCGGSGFPFSLSEWYLTICLTPYNRR